MEKKTKIHYTNESLSKKFKNNFDLVNYAIRLAENMIKTGRDARVKSEVENRAMLILEEINEGKDQFDEVKEPVPRTAHHSINGELHQELLNEERNEKRKYRAVDMHGD